MEFHHVPVLLQEVLRYLDPRPNGWYLDGTLGGAGHSAAIMEKTRGQVRLIGIDQDPEALAAAQKKLGNYSNQAAFVRSNFRNLRQIAEEQGAFGKLDGVLLDIGVSSHQLNEAERGFAYRLDAPLDMRMDPDATLTAARILNEYKEDELARIFWEYGEERWAKRIAKFIVERRSSQPFSSTHELVDVIRAAIPSGARQEGGHPAKRTFQALRIAVNDELGALQEVLPDAVEALAPGGKLVIISFHSLEDRLVKQFFADEARGCTCPSGLPVCACGKNPRLKVLTKKPVTSSKEELALNPRAQSAKLRAAERI